MNYQSDMERILKRLAVIAGFVVLAISIYFSYDGFDQSVTGANGGYKALAVIIGLSLAVVVCIIQFIFGTGYKNLNWTLRIVGLASYVYSIYTNKLGISHVLNATEFMSWAVAVFMDVFPEPAIAWGLGEALTGDLFGNIGKMLFGTSQKNNMRYASEQQSQSMRLGDQHRANRERKQKPINRMFSNKYTDQFKK